MKNVLMKCPKIKSFNVFAASDTFVEIPTDEHLDIVVQHAPPSLVDPSLCAGRFSNESLDAFITAFPASIKDLDLSDSECGFTPSNFRALLQRPLTSLTMDCIGSPAEYVKELEEMAVAHFDTNRARGCCNFYDYSEQ